MRAFFVQDFILSILHASPSARDSKSYLKSFGLKKPSQPSKAQRALDIPSPKTAPDTDLTTSHATSSTSMATSAVLSATREQVESILDPVHRHTALVKIQGPFTDRQLDGQ